MQRVILFAAFIFFGLYPVEAAAAPVQTAAPSEYVIQREDTLSRLADKFYQEPTAWPALWLATQQLAARDPHFAPLDNPHFLKPGQRLFIPPESELNRLLETYRTAYPLPKEPPPVPLGAAWLADFAGYVEEGRQHFEIPGVALAVVRSNQILLAQGFGVRELGQEGAVTPETLFAIGSTTKAMTSMLVASLVDEGLVEWDQPVVEIWPDFRLSEPALTPQIRLRDMLNMSSGLERADLAWSGSDLTPEQVMQQLAEIPVVAPPGHTFHYNNQMVASGGYLAALAAGGQYGQLGEAYAVLLQSRIFKPIGMESATLSVEIAQAHPNHAMPHDFNLDGQVLPTYYHEDPHIAPAGGVNAHVLDLARFLMSQLNRGLAPDGKRVVSAERLAETWQPQIELSPEVSYGMGWFIEDYQGIQMIWHDGDVLGFKSLFVMLPEADVGLVLLTNRTISFGFSTSIRYHLVEAVYGLEVDAGQYYRDQWTTFMETIPQIRAPLAAALPPAEVAPYLGQYSEGWQVEQRPDGSLWAIRGEYGWQLLAEADAKFIVSNGFGITTPLEFVQDEQGKMMMTFTLSTGEKGEYQQLNP